MISLRKAIALTVFLVALLFVAINVSTYTFIIQNQSQKAAATSEAAVSQLVADSKSLLEQQGVHLLTQKANDISSQMMQLKRLSRTPLNSQNAEFVKLAVQKVGETGYSCVYECQSAKMLAHPNPKLVGLDMRTLKDKLPSWWSVFGPSLNCVMSKGYYDWKEADGSIRKKYMVMIPVEGTSLMVAATTYLDEFTKHMNAIETEGRQKINASQEVFSKLTRDSYIAIAITSLIFLALMLMIGRVTSNHLLRGLDKIRTFAHELALGNYEMKFGNPPRLTELQKIFSSLDKMRDQILDMQKNRTDEASSAAAGRLSRQIAHDLRSPLAALTVGVKDIQEAELARGGKPDSQVAESLHMLRSVAHRLQEMIETVLRPKANFLQNIENFDVTGLFRLLVLEYEQKFRDSQRRIQFQLTDDSVPIHLIGSRMNLMRVFSNLIQNSTEAMPQGGWVRISVKKVGTTCEVRVIDNGVGVPKEILADIFKEGFTRGKRGGTGLGLSFCQQVISEHGGDIEVKSKEGQGTEVLLSFPLPVATAEINAQLNGIKPLQIQKGKRLFVIDDSVHMLTNWFKAAIAQGVEGDYFNSLEEARESIQCEKFKEKYGLVIVDYLIPQSHYDGVAACEEIRATCPDMPIVMCTSDFMNERVRTYCKKNGIELLPKTYFEGLQFTFDVGALT